VSNTIYLYQPGNGYRPEQILQDNLPEQVRWKRRRLELAGKRKFPGISYFPLARTSNFYSIEKKRRSAARGYRFRGRNIGREG